MYAPIRCCRFHQLLITEGEDVDFWEFLRDFSERLFLVPTPPVGHLAVVSEGKGEREIEGERGRGVCSQACSKRFCCTLCMHVLRGTSLCACVFIFFTHQ